SVQRVRKSFASFSGNNVAPLSDVAVPSGRSRSLATSAVELGRSACRSSRSTRRSSPAISGLSVSLIVGSILIGLLPPCLLSVVPFLVVLQIASDSASSPAVNLLWSLCRSCYARQCHAPRGNWSRPWGDRLTHRTRAAQSRQPDSPAPALVPC